MSEAPLPFPLPGGSNAAANGGAAEHLTRLLRQEALGGGDVRNELFKAVYGELRAIAARKMASERQGHTLQPTALVYEAWLKFGVRTFANRGHFFAAAAEAMRQILVDSARRRAQIKRGGNLERVELFDDAIAAPLQDEKLLSVHGALDTLAGEDSLKAEIVKLRYFVGLDHQEIADALGSTKRPFGGSGKWPECGFSNSYPRIPPRRPRMNGKKINFGLPVRFLA